MTINLYDGMNLIRREVDTDPMGRAPRKLVTQMLTPAPGDVHIWCFEGRGHLTERRNLFPNYKNRPSTMNEGFFALLDLIRKAFTHTSAIQIAVPGREADDVIAHLVQQHAGRMPIRIHSTDRDLNQLLTYPGVTSTAKPLENVHPRFVRLYKTYRGDASDKIPGIRGFGDKTWADANIEELAIAHGKLLADRAEISDFVQANLTPKMAERIIEQADHVKIMWSIVGFLPVDAQSLNQNTQVGRSNPDAADAILKEFRH